jgi:hypothetical protein
VIVEEFAAALSLELDEVGFQKAEHLLHGLHKGMMAFGLAAAGAAAVGLAYLGKSFSEAGDATRKLAQRTGVDSIVLQEFAHAAKLAGVGTDEMAMAMNKLAKKGVKDIRGEMLRLAEQFKGMPDDGRKVALAMDRFGRSGAKMIPMLNGGKEALAELMQEAHDLGIVMSEEDQIASEEFNDSIERLEAGFKGVGYSIGRQVLPYLQKFITGLRLLLRDLVHGAPWVDDLTRGLKLLGVMIGSYLVASTLLAAGSFDALGAAAIRAGAAWVKAAWPIALVAGLLGGIVLVLQDIWVGMHGGNSYFGDFMKSMDGIAAKKGSFTAVMAELVKGIFDLPDGFQKAGKAFDLWVDGLAEKYPILAALAATVGDIASATKGAATLGVAAVQGVGGAIGEGAYNLRYGGGSTPSASASNSQASANRSMFAPNINAPVTIQMAEGTSAADVTEELKQHFRRTIDDTVRGAAQGIQ